MLRRSTKNKRGLPFEIYEYYKSPPIIDAHKIVEKMLLTIPNEHLEGLGAVVLCDTESFRENYGDEEKIPTARYIVTKDKGQPWIEICVDRLLKGMPCLVLKIPFIRSLIFSEAIYHEIGHHIHWRNSSERQDSEITAEKWRCRLQKHYFLSRHYFASIFLLLIISPFSRILRRKYESLMMDSD